MFVLQEVMRAQAEVEVQLYSFSNLGVGWGLMFNAMPWLLYPRERDPVPISYEAVWAPGQVSISPLRDSLSPPPQYNTLTLQMLIDLLHPFPDFEKRGAWKSVCCCIDTAMSCSSSISIYMFTVSGQKRRKWRGADCWTDDQGVPIRNPELSPRLQTLN
jgi:hypothetical protein